MASNAKTKRWSFENMNGTLSTSLSLDDLVYQDEADSFKNLMEKARTKIDILRAQQQEIETFELYFYESRKKVRETADDLILKIRMHEERMLEEIEATKQSEYAKIAFSKTQLDETVKRLNSVYLRAGRLGDNNDDINKVQQDMTKELDALEKDDRFNAASLMKFSVLKFNPVRCNTAFGSTALHEDEQTYEQSPPGSAKKERNNSVSSMGSIEKSKEPTLKLQAKSRTVSLGTLLGESISNTGLAAGALAVPQQNQMSRSPLMMRRSSPIPLLKHLQMKEIEQQAPPRRGSVQASCVWSLAVDGSEPGQISGPNDVDFLPDGNILVCDRDNERLQVFDQLGTFVRIIAAGSIKPRRLSVIGDGHVAVTDSSDSTVKVFDQKDQCIIIWGKKWYKSIFKSPCGIAINSKQQPIVSDMEKRSVIVYNEEGKKVKTLQCDGSSKNDFSSPSYITTDPNDRIIVADNCSQTVKVFSAKGKYLFQFSRVDHDTRLKYPNGVCSDKQGNIYVADWGNHRVSMFDTRGVFLKHVLNKEDGIHHPAGIAISNDMMAVTAYSDQHSYVGVFRLKDREASP